MWQESPETDEFLYLKAGIGLLRVHNDLVVPPNRQVSYFDVVLQGQYSQ